jgi:hypothetical protein
MNDRPTFDDVKARVMRILCTDIIRDSAISDSAKPVEIDRIKKLLDVDNFRDLADDLDMAGYLEEYESVRLFGFPIQDGFYGKPGQEKDHNKYYEEEWEDYVDRVVKILDRNEAEQKIGDSDLSQALDL